MKGFLLILLLSLGSNGFSQSKEYLIRVTTTEEFELGDTCGYMNSKTGQMVAALGKYHGCYTDTSSFFAVVWKRGGGFVAIDLQGQERFDIYGFDNGPDRPKEGLFRILKEGKIGYANRKGEVVIEPAYSCAGYFENGKARVTYACELIPDGEYIFMESDTWFYIDRNGQKTEAPKKP